MEIKNRRQALGALILAVIFGAIIALGASVAVAFTITALIGIVIMSIWVLIVRDILLVPVKGVKGIKALRVKYLTGKLNKMKNKIALDRLVANEVIKFEVVNNPEVVKLQSKLNKSLGNK